MNIRDKEYFIKVFNAMNLAGAEDDLKKKGAGPTTPISVFGQKEELTQAEKNKRYAEAKGRRYSWNKKNV